MAEQQPEQFLPGIAAASVNADLDHLVPPSE
jgi:hypothetical protein